MPPGVLTAPQFLSRSPIQFNCADATAASINAANGYLQNNPIGLWIQPGTVAKIDLGINGKTYFRGDGEFAPFSIVMPWKVMSYTDYQRLSNLRPYLVTLISHRNDGFYGKLVMDGFQPSLKIWDVGSTTGTFYPLNPSDDGGATAVARIATPSGVTVTNVVGGGYIQTGTTNYYWVTFTSPNGETDPWASGSVSSGALSKNLISWTWPTTTSRCETAIIYVATQNNPAAAMQLAEVINGEPPHWNDLVGFAGAQIPLTPPTVNTAYRGFWQHGLWVDEA